MAENMYNWQYNTIPGNANQGAILMTRNDIGQPPFNQSDFIWKAMEDVIGTADVKLEYDEETNIYTLSKATGHQDNDGNWTYTWEIVGTWNALTDEVVELLRQLQYVTYRFDQQTTDNVTTLKMYGVKKDGTEDLITTITFVQKAYVDEALRNIKNILVQAPITATDSGNDRTLRLNYNTDDFKIENNALTSNLIDDEARIARNKTWSAYQIIDFLNNRTLTYKGEVQDKTLLPGYSSRGSVYGVINEADLYVNIAESSQVPANWYPFTYVAESFNAYGVELHKGTNGLYGKLRYDTIDFTIDNFNNLKSQIIDDTMGGSDTNADKKTYSIVKILQLLSSAMKYMGQVATYNDLPTNLTPDNTGYTYNVVDTGDNYAWSGTGWDKLAGDYIAGAGIVINGKTISATGISFVVGQGLEATGSGSTTNLHTKNGNGLQYDANNANEVKAGTGITVNSNGVNVNTGYTTKLENDNLEVNYKEGLSENANRQLIVKAGQGLKINSTDDSVEVNTNFATDSTPLGTDTSGFVIHSDGKLEVKAGVIQPELLGYINWDRNTNNFSTLTNNAIKRHTLFYLSVELKFNDWTEYKSAFGGIASCPNTARSVALPSMGPQNANPTSSTGWIIHNISVFMDTINGICRGNSNNAWWVNSWETPGAGNIPYNWSPATNTYDDRWTARIGIYGI